MTLEVQTVGLLQQALDTLETAFRDLPEFNPPVDLDSLRGVILEVAERMKDNYPYPHPFYIGQMLKPPHPVARLAYTLALWINPNNHALDGGRASSAMEKEAVADIAKMFGWKRFLGHLCGGGTMANMEGLWISRCLNPGKRIVASSQAHYTHSRLCGALGIPFHAVGCDSRARMDTGELTDLLKKGNVGTVVVTIGTTATGSVDPLLEILELQEKYGFRIHADAAYGGYFLLVDTLDSDTRAVYDHLSEVDSIAIDPHKHGLQPYGCGCILFKDPAVGKFYKHDSPYTYFTSDELHLGEISLECSRAGASAVALWATHRLLPLVTGSRFASDLGKCVSAARRLFELVNHDSRFITGLTPELDIVVWTAREQSASAASRLCNEIFEEAATRGLHLAKANLPRSIFSDHWPDLDWDQEQITCFRSCLMKPEHLDWMDRIWETFAAATTAVKK
ncbi:MAG: aspartate aminotransferase family protein [Deltaproteobacteria bacterium]|nr:aspartate aminotransferase family protein [Deltaproteobacteria bacterium]